MSISEVNDFMVEYWKAGSSGSFDKVIPFVNDNATFFFSEGPYTGLEEIQRAFETTWATIVDEKYIASNVKWILLGEMEAVCTYDFTSEGCINNKSRVFHGLGTNVLQKIGDNWKIIHEHLSAVPLTEQ